MIIDKLTIENIFCYYGRRDFEFTPPGGPVKKIAVIYGRNGQGKTSFLNSVKLLFGGVSDELRANAVTGKKILHQQYVLGHGENWQGILNRRAVQEGRTRYCISAELHHDTDRIIIERSWDASGNERVVFQKGGHKHTDDAAKEHLFELMPSYSIPFFFFDGEIIQGMASDDDSGRLRAMASLLDLEPLRKLGEDISSLRSRWAHEAADESDRVRLVELQGRLKTELAKEAQLESRLESLGEERTELLKAIAQLEAELKTIEEQGSDEDRGKIQGEKKSFEQQVEESRQRFLGQTLPLAPLLFCADLVERTKSLLAVRSDSAAEAQSQILVVLRKELPRSLFDMPPQSEPPLTPEQVHHYRSRLVRILDSYIPEPLPSARLGITVEARQRVLDQLQGHGEVDRGRSSAVENLNSIVKLHEKIQQADTLLEEVVAISDEERVRRAEIRSRLKAAQTRQGELDSDLGRLRGPELKAQRAQIKALRAEIEEVEVQLERNEKIKQNANLSRKLSKLMQELIQLVRETHRSEIESKLNEYFFKLFDSNQQIKHISLDENFILHYESSPGNRIGRSSISAGMKQMVAVSLLWALKESSRRRMPVVIDTPLARLDRNHQQNIIEGYLPNVSEQVILLPTNSELDQERLEPLKKYIYRQYELVNPEGDNTEIRAVGRTRDRERGA